MSDDWKPGDLLLCLHIKPRECPTYSGLERLRAGAVYTLAQGPFLFMGRQTAVTLREVRSAAPGGCFSAHRFRKINPLTDEERASFLAELDAPEPARLANTLLSRAEALGIAA